MLADRYNDRIVRFDTALGERLWVGPVSLDGGVDFIANHVHYVSVAVDAEYTIAEACQFAGDRLAERAQPYNGYIPDFVWHEFPFVAETLSSRYCSRQHMADPSTRRTLPYFYFGSKAFIGLRAQRARARTRRMSEALPDRLSVNPKSPFYDEAHLDHEIGVKVKGVEKTNVEEYCISEGWVKIAVGKQVDRKGNPLTITVKGPVEVWVKDAES